MAMRVYYWMKQLQDRTGTVSVKWHTHHLACLMMWSYSQSRSVMSCVYTVLWILCCLFAWLPTSFSLVGEKGSFGEKGYAQDTSIRGRVVSLLLCSLPFFYFWCQSLWMHFVKETLNYTLLSLTCRLALPMCDSKDFWVVTWGDFSLPCHRLQVMWLECCCSCSACVELSPD